MSTVLPLPREKQATITSPLSNPIVSNSAVSAHARSVAGHKAIRMGRTATANEGVNWITLIALIAFHIGAVAALFFFSWERLIVMLVLYVLAINVGIGMCYHRLLTHRGYEVPKWLEYAMTVCATLALEGGPMFWVATHRVHHQHSDQQGDPHTPRDGKWWAHAGWLIFGDAMASESALLNRYVPDLARDRFHNWISKYHWLPLVGTGVLLFSGGALQGGWVSGVAMVLWGVFLRVTIGLHTTWLVNSATHLWGSRRFSTRDDSRNSWWVALLSGGEGWHNNHHAHPVSARHGLRWFEIDPNFYGIWLLSKVGLAKHIRVAQFDRADPRPAGL